MHHEINTIIQHEGRNFKVTESGTYPVIDGCEKCAFYNGKDESCGWILSIHGYCYDELRPDGKNVHFREVDAQGEPIPEPCYLTFSDDDLPFGPK